MIKFSKLLLASMLFTVVHGADTTKIVEGKKSEIIDKSITNNMIKSSIVKIFTVANESDLYEPWASHINKFSGSGCIIDGQRILTNAHVVSDSTFIEVLKNGGVKRYEADVLSINHEADLALITIKDKSFFEGTKSLEFGELPELQKEVTVYGFPSGGETLSITKGVISRIEHNNYVHSNKLLLSIQIDAAINGGNSGGPAISDDKVVGLVMQSRPYAENMGYIIPPSVINHYLEDMKDGRCDGYPFLGIKMQSLDSPVMKRMYGIEGQKYGILINKTIPNSPVDKILKTGDILTAIDGYKIFSNQKVEFRDKEYTNFRYALNKHQMGDSVELTILRNSKEKKVSIKLDKKPNELSLVKERKHESRPTYFIYGGFVFMPATESENGYYSQLLSKYDSEYPNEKREELVLLTRVLSSSLTKGYDDKTIDVVETVNGKSFKNFKEFVHIIEHSKEKFIVLEDKDHFQMVLDRKEVLAKQQRILEKYYIKSAKSDDLLNPSSKQIALK